MTNTKSTLGTVYWVTGLSGAGKTTIGKLFYEKLKNIKPNVVFLDGDTLRDVLGNDFGHSPDERKKLTMRYSRLCRLLASQGIDVICATISMFDDCRYWNRRNIESYVEIYVRVSMDVLIGRDQKELYSRALRGEIENVIGVDVKLDEPKCPDFIIDNEGNFDPCQLVEELWRNICRRNLEVVNEVR
jgi:adenylylsulfate kinase